MPRALDDELRRVDRGSEALEAREGSRLGRLLLEWGGAREVLEERGVTVEVWYTTDGSWALDGGADEGDTAVRSLLDVVFALETGPSLGLPGGTLFSDLQWVTGVDASQRFGVLQAISNIDADRRLQLARLWYEQRFEDTRTSLRVGKIDANSVFAYVDEGSGFLNGSMGFSPTILSMPSYPDAATGALLKQGLGEHLELRLGAFDGSLAYGVRTGLHGPHTWFESPRATTWLGELDLTWDAGRLGLGGWWLDGDLPRFDGGVEDGTGGLYLTLDQALWRNASDQDHYLGAFLQLGSADGSVSPFVEHFGTGVVLHGAATSARVDHLGLGVTRVRLSDEAGAAFTEDDETAIELFWGFELQPWLRVKPDLQYVVHPGGDAALDDLFVASVRLTVAL
ncbi:MAG TPA: carbohydrate porin [Planctomycetota bacterium]|nr:carbohydrate porin [Planctomycetota bacterium]